MPEKKYIRVERPGFQDYIKTHVAENGKKCLVCRHREAIMSLIPGDKFRFFAPPFVRDKLKIGAHTVIEFGNDGYFHVNGAVNLKLDINDFSGKVRLRPFELQKS